MLDGTSFPMADTIPATTDLDGIQGAYDRMLEGVGGRTVALPGSAQRASAGAAVASNETDGRWR
jgi:hypothetical protein